MYLVKRILLFALVQEEMVEAKKDCMRATSKLVNPLSKRLTATAPRSPYHASSATRFIVTILDAYISANASVRGSTVASRDEAPFHVAGSSVITLLQVARVTP
jgi:hypothetical protein